MTPDADKSPPDDVSRFGLPSLFWLTTLVAVVAAATGWGLRRFDDATQWSIVRFWLLAVPFALAGPALQIGWARIAERKLGATRLRFRAPMFAADTGRVRSVKLLMAAAALAVAMLYFYTDVFLSSSGRRGDAGWHVADSSMLGFFFGSLIGQFAWNTVALGEKGVLWNHRLVKWQDIGSANWVVGRPRILRLRWTGGVIFPVSKTFLVPEDQRADVEAFIRDMMRGANAASPWTEVGTDSR